jgi:GNAT superfamily N-acetyltransferase
VLAYGPATALGERPVVGYIEVTVRPQETELDGFYVDPPYQHRGYGRMLFETALAISGDRPMVVGVTTGTTAHREIYPRLGFQPTDDPADDFVSTDADNPPARLRQSKLRRPVQPPRPGGDIVPDKPFGHNGTTSDGSAG